MISEEQEKLLNLKRLVQTLEQSNIDGSAITMCLLPAKNMNQYRSLLASQIAQASNIKDKSNKQSVVQSLKSAKEAIKDYKKAPPNGLLLISATVMLPHRNVYQKVVSVIQPHRPITKEVYCCGKFFNFSHIKEEILINDESFGFIIVDGNSVLIAKVKGGHKQILKEIKSDIMRNHNKGGQSSVRFARLRDQSRFNFIKISCQQSNKVFGSLNEEINGYIIAGSANLKMHFVTNEALSASIKNKIIKVIDVAQGAEQGLKQAILQSKNIITDAVLLKQKQILAHYFDNVNTNCERVTNGFKSVAQMISIGLAEKVICCKNKFKDQQIQQIQQLCNTNGCQLIFVTNKSQEGEFFSQNYGGICAYLRYEFDWSYLKQEFMDQETGINQKQQFFL